MGFTAGLYRYPKYKKTILSDKDLSYIDNYLEYKNNEWAQERFASAEDYALYCLDLIGEEKATYKCPDKQTLQFYAEQLRLNEFNRLVFYDEMGYWCSNGSGEIYRWFEDLAKTKNNNQSKYGMSFVLDMKDIIDFALFCWGYIQNHMPQSCSINRAFKYIKPEHEEDEEEYDIHSMHCDGIEVTFENGGMKRFDTSEDFENAFYIFKDYYDEWEMSGYITGLETALEILRSTNFETEFIKYSGGW